MSVGNGLLVLLIFWSGRAVFGNPAWFDRPGLQGYLLMAVTELVLIIPLEWIMMYEPKW
jgi:hypothetical protein